MATIRDVARKADVSIATVSRVLNGHPRVSQATRERVAAAARELDYWPNSAARSLITSRTHVLGVLLPDLYGEFYSEVIRGIDHAARTSRFQILISSSHADTDELMSAALSMRGRIDGLLVMAPDGRSGGALERLRDRFPLMLINSRGGWEGCSSFSIANHEGALAITQHLLTLGHQDIAFVTGPKDNVDAERRLSGYCDALRAAGIDPDPTRRIEGDFTEASGHAAARRLLGLQVRPTAVFAANDAMAIGLLSALHEADVRVPQEVSVAGFDDIAIAQYVTPPLTTVRVDAFALGKKAVEQLVYELACEDPVLPRHEVLATNLVVRRSCAMAVPVSARDHVTDAPDPRRRS